MRERIIKVQKDLFDIFEEVNEEQDMQELAAIMAMLSHVTGTLVAAMVAGKPSGIKEGLDIVQMANQVAAERCRQALKKMS